MSPLPGPSLRRERALVAMACVAGLLLRLWRAQELPPFADSYHHWLVAARLAEEGGASRLFTQPDGAWPPLYSLVAGALLWLFGTRPIALLSWASIACAGLTTWLVGSLGRPTDEERRADPRLSYAGPLAAALYALCPLDILTASTPAMEPLAVLLLCAHLWLRRGEGAGRAWLAGLCLAAACLTRYEAWGFVGIGLVAAWRARTPRRLALFGPALLVCGLWAAAAGFGALSEKLAPEAARHTGELSSWGAVAGRALVLVQTLLLAAAPLLPAGVLGMRAARAGLAPGARAFALVLLGALLAAVVSGVIAGSHRYLALALPLFAVGAAQSWLTASRRQAWWLALLPLGLLGMAAAARYAQRDLDWDLGLFWFFWQPLPLLCLAATCAGALLIPRGHGGIAALATSASVAVAYLPLLSAQEIGRFVVPFRDAGIALREEAPKGLVVFDNPVPAYFSGLPVSRIVMANRAQEASQWLGRDTAREIAAHARDPEEVYMVLRAHGVSHLVSEEVPYLFTRAKLIPGLPGGALLPVYWTRAVIQREIAIFRIRD